MIACINIVSFCFCLLANGINASTSSSSSDSSSSEENDEFIFNSTVFSQFKSDVIELIECDACYGLTASHPDVSIYDVQGNPDSGKNMIPALIRLVFHDCGGIVPNLVALGENEFFMNSEYNGYSGGCNGCIGIDNSENDNLLESTIEPVSDICDKYDLYISRADCWALAATIAVEYGAAEIELQTVCGCVRA